MSALFSHVVMAVIILNVVNAVTFLECVCSPSNRGYRTNVLNELIESRMAILKFTADQFAKLKLDPALKRSDLQTEINQLAFSRWYSCLSNWKHEECVNADTKLRSCDAKNKESCVSFCKFSTNNWRNLLNGREAVGCDTNPVLASEDPSILSGNPQQRTETKPLPTPTPTPSKQTALPIPTKTPPADPNDTNQEFNSADTSAAPVAGNGTNQNAPPVDEGCVAIEHLEGYALQHGNHLRRTVLCSASEAFCATPNHAIIVDGKWTSMKQLCQSTWKCVRTVKLVNNLRITSHRRAVISERIVVTPFDLRFPRWCVWMVQILQMVSNMIGLVEIMAGFVAFFMYNRKHLNYYLIRVVS